MRDSGAGVSRAGTEFIGKIDTMTAAPPDSIRMLAMPPALAEQGFAFRPEVEADIPFLRRLYISTRWEELAIVDWSDEQKIAFLESQFGLQRHHYYKYYPTTAFAVLEQHGTSAGRLYLERRPKTMTMIDIALLPEYRGRGTGTALIEAALAEAAAAGQKVSIMVEKFNPAQRLYRRLGFAEVADHGVHWEMEWRPTPAGAG
jgi:ribosomal protein S18 acetylase RimI-like enzyme